MKNENRAGNALLVANYSSDVGYAWWLMENFWVEISRIMAGRGQKTFLAYPQVCDVPSSIKSAPIEVVELDFKDDSPSQELALLEFIQSNSIRFVYLSDKPYRASIYKKIRRAGVEIIVDHDHSPGCSTFLSKLLRSPRNFYFRRSRSACDAYIAVSQFVYRKMVDFAGLPRELCRTVQNGIPPIELSGVRQDYRKVLGLPEDAFLIVTVGRASVYKGIDFLIECAYDLVEREDLKNLHFIFCGDGPDLEFFRSLVLEKSLQERFHCLGRRTDVRDLLVGCDLAVHASPLEACSLSILEYMSAGLPTLAPAVGGNVEQIVDGETGYFYKYRDQQDLVEKIKHLYQNRALRQTMGAAGARRVRERFSLEVMNKVFRESVVDILGSDFGASGLKVGDSSPMEVGSESVQ